MGMDSPVSMASLTTQVPSMRTASASIMAFPLTGMRTTSPGTSSIEEIWMSEDKSRKLLSWTHKLREGSNVGYHCPSIATLFTLPPFPISPLSTLDSSSIDREQIEWRLSRR